MRRFWLKKGTAIWDLSAPLDSITGGNFFGGPEGLGVKIKVESFEIERASFVESIKMQDVDIGGTLYFLSYEHFTNFVNFIGYVETTEPLRLYYSTAENPNYESNDEWYKLVLIKELDKTEIEAKTGVLSCKVKFQSLSRWKRDQIITLELNPFGDALVYPYFYPYVYGGRNNMAVEIDNTNNLPTSCIVKIEAETDTPLFRILQNGEILDQAEYGVYIRPGSYAIINSAADKQEASLYTETTGGGLYREDIYYLGNKDYAYSNFITIPEGISTFLFTAANSVFGKVTIQYSLQKELI